MIASTLLITFALLLLLVLLTWATKDNEMENYTTSGQIPDSVSGEPSRNPLPASIVFQIFCREDWEFILRMRSPRLRRMYQEERRRVALQWVERTSQDVSDIMRAHRLASRQSRDLDVATESKLLFQYFKLRLLCGLLVVFIRVFGPHALGDMAAQASDLYQGIGRSLRDVSLAGRMMSAEETTTH
jgi:hypothetical protein